MHAAVHVWRSEDNLKELVLSFTRQAVGVVRLGRKCLYLTTEPSHQPRKRISLQTGPHIDPDSLLSPILAGQGLA